ncbi:sodium:solute symporter family transporter [Rheinheimera sp. 4Y26]|uniref:sodium:solute symporter family transporter n=1 Tax=Rheinheimera sp. 4Y26 TaxID=2977811 RepID=UPI0021B0A620|nr:sodium/solute symporter [Rheinheimera sp. 4Y26]MCT6698623.1 sodium/solute symporter [Rheinheimera sp. 4Y26]
MTLSTLDLIIVACYLLGLLLLAYQVSREKSGHAKGTNDYFLAGNSLPWWAIGASLIAANISAEQIIGMSGSGYAIGLAIASYEWMAAISLIIVGKYFLPVFLKRQIYTMPQFLQQRFDNRVRTTLALFWLAVYVLVNLTAVLWLGALAVNAVTGLALFESMLLLALLSLTYSLYGGLKAVAFTDIIQVVLLVAGGLFLSYVTLQQIGAGAGVLAGLDQLMLQAPDKFDMILSPDHPHYASLPGLSVLLGGLWVMNLSYWGFNQYIIQRALAAKDLAEAQKGIVFAAFLKILMPLIVVLPGIAAVLILPDLAKPDQAYPALMNLMPSGIKGLIFAALVAAILSSLASMTNSVATIFTMDIYRQLKPAASQQHYVLVARLTGVGALLLALVTAKPLLGDFDQAFQYIQEFTGFFTPGIVALFLLGMFWPRTTANAALAAAIGSALLSLLAKQFWPELPFMDRVGLVFLSCLLLAVLVTLAEQKPVPATAVQLSDIRFDTKPAFNLAAVAVSLVVASFYYAWW